jgi:hypothetical protein
MKQEVLIGQTDYTVLVKIRDTAGAAKTGLTEASIDIAYARVETDNDVTTTDVTPAALSALTDAHTDWGFEEVSATDHPGLYRLDIADAVFASGAWSAVVTVVGTGLDPADMEFVLVPNSPLTGVLLAPTTHTSAVIPTVTTTGTATAVTTVNGLAAGVITAAAIADNAIDAGAIAADAITSAKIADNAITAAKINADAITAAKIAAGAIDAATFAADVDAEVRSWLGLASADLDTQLGTLASDSSSLNDIVTSISNGLFLTDGGLVGNTGNDTTHVHLDGMTEGDDELNNQLLVIRDLSENETHARWIDDWTGTGDLATVATLPFTPASGDLYWVVAIRRDITVASYQSGQAPLQPTVAGRTLDVTAGGEAGIDWANVGSPTTTVNLSGTTVKDATDVNTDTDTLLSRMGTPSNLGGGATLAANLSDIEAQTDDIGAAGAGLTDLGGMSTTMKAQVEAEVDDALGSGTGTALTAIPWNAAWDAEVQSEVQDAIEVNNLDHLVKSAVDTDFATTVHLNSVVGHLADNGSSATFDRTTDSLEALQAEHDSTQSSISGLNNLSQANIRTAIGLASANLDTQLDALPTAAENADAVWDEATSGHTTSGTFGEQVKTDIDEILTDTGTTLQAEVDGIQADTEDIQSRLPAALTGDGNIKADALKLNGAAPNNLSAAQVNAEVVDALATDTYAEPASVPAATSSLKDKINWLFALARNKLTQTSTTQTLRNDADNSSIATSTDSDDGTTYTRGEWS